MEVVLINDLRTPDFGAPRADVIAATLDLAEWADNVGIDILGFGEHHNSDDGYNPSPLVLAAACAGRTRRIRLRSAVLLASCYDPVRLAEDAAMLQIVSNGRFEMGLGFGYRKVEFEMYGRRLEDRFETTCILTKFLKRAWTGEAFEFEGRKVQIKPLPPKSIPIMLGGAAPKTARAAAQLADGFFVPLFGEEIWRPYREECLKLGRRDPGDYPNQGPGFLWISENPEKDWDWIAPHALHVLDSYGRWAAENDTLTPYAGNGMTPDSVRQSPAYKVMTPDEAIALVQSLGDNASLYLAPFFAGIDPSRGWKMLKLYERHVHPHVPRGVMPTWRHQ
jgi:alkanesulfonate monooxygenase SsuD/methylene tetrahydromethanopterin reductase-like flavin-dependent oxidoreductase (luciferase family)